MLYEIEQVRDPSVSEYWVRKDGEALAFAVARTRNFQSVIDVNSLKGIYPKWRFTIKRKFKLWRIIYELELTDGSIARLENLSYWKHDFKLCYKGETFLIYGHQYLSASIFKGEEQVAFLSKKNMLTILDKDFYSVYFNNDLHPEPMISIALIWDRIYARKSGINLGQLSESRSANLDWEPKG